MSYRKTLMGLVSSIAILAAVPSMAQTANSNSNSSSGSNSASGSISSSRSQGGGGGNANAGVATTTNTGVTLNQNSTTPAATTSNSTLNDHVSGGTSSTVANTGFTSSDVTVRTTPTVYAPPVSGGNPCTLAVSGGVSVIGWGAAAGGTFVDQDCANRQKIAMVWNSGLHDIAFELMCNDRDTYNATKMAGGKQCSFRQNFEPAQAPGAAPRPMVQNAPTPVVYTPPPSPPGRFVCMDVHGRIVPQGAPGASCGQI